MPDPGSRVLGGEIQQSCRGAANETVLKQGDVVIQRGTNHAWANRSGKACRMLFVLIDGRFQSDIPGAKAPL